MDQNTHNVMATSEPAPRQVFRMVDSRTPASQTKDARGASGKCGCGGCGCGGKGKKRQSQQATQK